MTRRASRERLAKSQLNKPEQESEDRVYTLVRSLKSRAVAVREVCTFAAAFVTAELFYKFHSFSLECLAFLLTWSAFSGLADLGMRRFERRGGLEEEP
jgi:hypothetical protein